MNILKSYLVGKNYRRSERNEGKGLRQGEI